MTEPLVSCLMPTADRPRFVELAVRLFLRQTYRAKELVVVDDGARAVGPVLPALPTVRYCRLAERLPLGEKRNLACALAEGELLAHWDDDDWSAPSRLADQVAALRDSAVSVCGVSALRYLEPATRRAWIWQSRDGDPWLFGGSLCYRREAWRRSPFPRVDRGEEVTFVSEFSPAERCDLGDACLLVGILHARNTSSRPGGGSWLPLRYEAVARGLSGDLDCIAKAVRSG